MSGTTSPLLSTSIKEFTIPTALLMSIIAISIDALLPALGEVDANYTLAIPNMRNM